MKRRNILLIRFSFRESGNCKAIADKINEFYSGEHIVRYTVDTNSVPACSNCDYECLTPDKFCPKHDDAHTKIMDAICNADLVYFIVPNYCGYPCANYFAFNERSVGYFNKDQVLLDKYMAVPKRFIIVSNSESENFVGAMQQQVNGEPEILYLKSAKYGKRSIVGDLMESEATEADLKAFLEMDISL